MKFVELTRPDKEPVHINVDMIVRVMDTDSNTEIMLANGVQYVSETVAQVMTAIKRCNA